VSRIVVEHRDRVAPFGVEYLEAALEATGRRIIVLHQDEVVVNEDEVKDDLVRDMIEARTSM
jgi:putative resolvase